MPVDHGAHKEPVKVNASPGNTRRSSLSVRLAMLLASLLVLSAIATAIYAASSVRATQSDNSSQSMANVHAATRSLIDQTNAGVQHYRTDTLATRESGLKEQTQILVASLDNLRAAAAQGKMTVSEAQSLGKQLILDATYGPHKSYFFAFTPDMLSIAEPNPKFVGNMIDYRDPAGKYFFHDFRDVAKGPGAGYVNYVGTRLGSSVPAAKVSYIQMYKPWQWVVGTGVYIDDINTEAEVRLEAARKSLGVSLSGVTFSSAGFVFVLDRTGKVVAAPAGHPLGQLSSTAAGRALVARAIALAPTTPGPIAHFVTDASFRNGHSEPWQFDVSIEMADHWILVSTIPTEELTRAGNLLALRQGLLELVVLMIGLVVGLLASRRIARPVEQLTRAATALEQNRFDPTMLDDAATRKDELGSLARAFRHMGSQIVERERSLREQVKRLTIGVDRDKVAQSVNEIGDDDYFRDLQERGKQLREGK